MIVRIFLVFLFIHEASLEVTVEGVVSGSVVLPCSGKADQGTIQDIDVYWRHKESRNVYDIIKGKGSDEDQELEYKNRAESFPEVYLKGNFSLRLKNLRETDAGKYSCLITKESKEEIVKLIVKGRPEISEDKNNHKGEKLEDKKNQGAQKRPEMIVMFLLPLSILGFMRKRGCFRRLRIQRPLLSFLNKRMRKNSPLPSQLISRERLPKLVHEYLNTSVCLPPAYAVSRQWIHYVK